MGKKTKRTYNRTRHKIIFAVCKPLARVFLRLGFNWHNMHLPKDAPKFKQYVALSNHNSDLDVIALCCALPGVCHFVASDHILKWKPWGSVIKFGCEPIAISRAQMDLKAIKDTIRCKKEGGSIGIFPEGGCSYTGRTTYIASATAKLVKQLGLPVYMYGIEGDFLMTPCPAENVRRGHVQNVLRKWLTAEEVAEMSIDDLLSCIRENLYVDAYAVQREKMYVYKGKDKAEGLETSLYKCPKCGALCKMESRGDDYFCNECGYKVTVNDYGFFEGEDVVFDSITAWDDWQREEIVRCVNEGEYDLTGNTPILQDEGEIITISEKAKDTQTLGSGTFSMYYDRFELHGENVDFVWPFSDIEKLRATERDHLTFSTGGDTYVNLTNEHSRSSYKYMLHYNALKRHAKGKPMDNFGA